MNKQLLERMVEGCWPNFVFVNEVKGEEKIMIMGTVAYVFPQTIAEEWYRNCNGVGHIDAEMRR